MANFDAAQSYAWPAVHWDGTYSGPTDSARLATSTAFDTSGFVNAAAGTFGWSLDVPGPHARADVHPDGGAGAGDAGTGQRSGHWLGDVLAAAVAIERPVGYSVGMTRRRLILGICVVVVALGAAWWLFGDGLSSEERLLVGKWHCALGQGWRSGTAEFGADRQGRLERADPIHGLAGYKDSVAGRWSLQEAIIYPDYETDPIRRRLRSLCYRPGITVATGSAYVTVSVSADKFVISNPNGWTEVWTRDRRD
jgi:hypothetical protein